MSLQVWLPLTGNLNNQGLSPTTVTNGGATVNSTGKIGSCYSFDGSDDYIALSSTALYNCFKGSTQGFTIAFWIYNGESSGARAVIFGDYGLSGSFNVELNGNSTNNSIRFYWGGSPDYAASSTIAAVNAWTHIAICYTGSNVKFYQNGTLTNTYSGVLEAKNKTSGSFYLGRDSRTGTTCLLGRLNDFRVYDNCLSATEVRDLAKGLVLHYPMKDDSIESTTNYIKYPTPGNPVGACGWDTTKHVNAIQVSNWSSGYNGGVSSPSTGYHACWKVIDNIPTIVFQDKNSEISQTHRWLGISGGGLSTSQITTGTVYTVSFDAKADVSGKKVACGLYYKKTSDGSNGFHDGCPNIDITTDWRRYSYTYTCAQMYSISGFYFYGHYGTEGVSYVRNIQIEIKNHSTAYTPSTRNNTVLQDVSGYKYNGTISGSLVINSNSPRYSKSIRVTGCSVSHTTPLGCKGTNQEWTCSAWVYPLANSASRLNNFNLGNYLYYSAGGKPLLYLNSGDNDYYTYGSTVLPLNTWTFVTYVFRNSDGFRKVYFNGNLADSGGPNKTSTPAGLANTTTSFLDFNGYISDYRIYATALSASDIQDLYNAPIKIASDGVLITNGEVVE